MLPQIPMPGTQKPTTPPTSSAKSVLTHALAAALASAATLGLPAAKDALLVPKAAEVKKDAAPTSEVKPSPAPAPSPPAPLPLSPKIDPYAVKLREAWEVDPHGHPVYLKRLLYLYRAVLANTIAGKSEADVRAAFAAEEKRLGMFEGLPVLRSIIIDEWHAQVPDNIAPEIRRANSIKFWNQTIGILEKLP